MECSDCSLALRYSLDRWPRYPLARSRTTLRFLWALTARFTRAISFGSLTRRTGLLAQQLLYLLQVGRRQGHFRVQPPGPRGRLVLIVVLWIRPAPHDLAGSGDPEPLLGAAMRL